MGQKIKIRRGLKKDLPVLEIGELGLCTDTKELYIGTESGNELIGGNTADKTTITKGSNGTINVDGVEIKVFDDEQIKSLINSKVDTSALNYKADVTDLDKAISAVNANLFGKVNKTEVDSLLANKVEKSYVDNAIANVQTIKGDKGDTGLQGDRGLQGLQGLKGDKGDTGDRGLQGLKGEQGEKGADGTGVAILGSFAETSLLPAIGNTRGDAYLINGDMHVWSGAKWDNVGRIKGDTGEKGAKGDQGIQGIKGDTGSQGPKGDQGLPGNKGDKGESTYTWIKYATSADGVGMSDSPVGMTYIGIASNKTTDTKSSNATDYTWVLFKGADGEQGANNLVLVATDSESTATGSKTITFPIGTQGLTLTNTGANALTFIVNELTYTVESGKTFTGGFTPFTTLFVTATGTYKYYPMTFAPIGSAPSDKRPPILTVSPHGGDFTSPQNIVMETNEIADIFYTLDGTEPTANSTRYIEPLYLSGAKVLKVFARDMTGNVSYTQTINFNIVLPPDLIPPTLTITSGGSFSGSKTVVMSVDEIADIFYTLDGTTPTTTSSKYVSPLVIENTTTCKAFARDNAGNVSPVQTITYTKETGLVTSGLVVNYDFTNKIGTTSNTILDTVLSIPANLTGITHNETSGYKDNTGLVMPASAYVTLPTATDPLKTALVNLANGYTISAALKISGGSQSVVFRSDNVNFRMTMSSALAQLNYQYVATDDTIKNAYTQFSNFKLTPASSTLDFTLIKSPSTELDIITFRLSPSNIGELFVNGYKSNQTLIVPADFKSFVNPFSAIPFYIRRDTIGINGTSVANYKSFNIYNRSLTDAEISSNRAHHLSSQPFSGVTVLPDTVTMRAGDTQQLLVSAIPYVFTPDLTITYESGNTAFLTVNAKGLVTGVMDGETNVKVTASYGGITFQKFVSFKIGAVEQGAPTTTRTISGMSINRSTSAMKLGEAFVAMATALSTDMPFDVFDDNVIVWSTSNPNVCQVNYGLIQAVGVGTATITASDESLTHSKSFKVTVAPKPVEVILPEEIYTVPLSSYGISNENTNAAETTVGIVNAFKYAKENNFKKIVFPVGIYQVIPTAATIYWPSNMVTDFSNSRINIAPSSKTATGYVMFSFKGATRAKVINTHIFGEADSTTLVTSVESCLSVEFNDCYESGLVDCTVSKSPGFNIETKTSLNKSGTTGTSIGKDIFEAGNILSGVNDNTRTANHFRTKNFLNISGLGDIYMLGYNQGYFGFNHLRSRLYSIHFYDSTYTYISSQMHNLQFYTYQKPTGAAYAKIVIYQATAPTTQDSDFSAVAFLRTVAMARNCYIINTKMEDNFSTGLAMCGGESFLLENNTFSRNNGRTPACDIDWEDGWECMIGDVVRGNTFNSAMGVIVCAGGSLAMINNNFNKSGLLTYGRTQNYRILNNTFDGRTAFGIELNTQAESVFARNVVKGITPTVLKNHPSANYKVGMINNTVV